MHFHTRTLSSVFVLFLFSKNIILFTHSPVKLKRQRHTTNIQINKYANCSPRFPFRFRPAVRFELISLSFRLVSFRQFGKRFESVCMLSLYTLDEHERYVFLAAMRRLLCFGRWFLMVLLLFHSNVTIITSIYQIYKLHMQIQNSTHLAISKTPSN